MKILVLAAHPDDEVLGMGATIKKLTGSGHKVNLCVVTEGASAQYKNNKFIKIRKDACSKSSKILGISKIDFLDYPDMNLDTIPHLEINNSIENIIEKTKPEIVYTTPSNDLNKDHQVVCESTMIAVRPNKNIKKIISYEIPGYVKNQFHPNVYNKIVKELSTKIRAFKCYKTEIEKFPHPRSLEMIECMATLRGMESGLIKAEAFQLIRSVEG